MNIFFRKMRTFLIISTIITWSVVIVWQSYADWDSSTNMQGLTASQAFTQTQDNFKALDGTSGASPDSLYVAMFLGMEGTTPDAFEVVFTPVDPTADQQIIIPNDSGTLFLSTLSTNEQDAANSLWGTSNALTMEGATADAFETSLTPQDPTADRTITIPNLTGTMNVGYQLFTATGANTFIAPSGVSKVYLTCSAGGGGGGGNNGTGAGGGGASGRFCINYPFTVVPGNSYTVTIGAGGAGGAAGNNDGTIGGTTSFDTLSLTGGNPGKGSDAPGTGLGGAGIVGWNATTTTAGNIYYSGNGGDDTGTSTGSGAGGGTIFGQGAASVSGNADGLAASDNTGGGGSGASGGGNRPGGNGGSGVCLVTW